MKLQIKVGEDGIISDVKFKTFGCGSAIASSSYMCVGALPARSSPFDFLGADSSSFCFEMTGPSVY